MDSGGLNDFLQQIPVGLIVLFCGSGILLLIVTGSIVNSRSRRARQAIPPANFVPAYDDADGDLPDLDALASTEAVAPAASVPVVSAAPPPSRPTGTFSVALTEGETVDVVEVLSIARSVEDGSLIIRIGDKAYRNPPAVADAEFKRRFHAALRDLNAVQPPAPAKKASAEAARAPATDDLPMPASFPPVGGSAPLPGDLPKFKMPEGPPVKPKRGQRPVAEPIPEIDIAGAIEAFLQHKLMLLPEYQTRNIHVRPAPHGGVKIEVGDRFYDSVSDVEDADVRQLLTATIEEWQARQ
ncbi:MAG: hypothetical protein IT319_02025 [Anaerolineae bacterium]|nr:hypothetical protein [Anaerolineae bacterium]